MELPQLLPHCNVPQQQFCGSCRNREAGREFRKGALERNNIKCDVDFVCPKGKPWEGEPVSIMDQAKNVVKAAAKAVKSVAKTEILRKDRTPQSEYDRRMAICKKCPEVVMKNGRVHTCGQMFNSMTGKLPTCGCVLGKKARDEKEECPLGKWSNK